MNVSYVNPFIQSTIETFKNMLNVNATPGKITIKQKSTLTYDISGIIGLSGDAQGAIAVSLPKLTALKVVSAMLGTKIKVIGDEVTDGVGELVNIVAGNAKKDLTQYKLSISLPKVVIGSSHFLDQPGKTPVLLVPFTCSFGEFMMEVSLMAE